MRARCQLSILLVQNCDGASSWKDFCPDSFLITKRLLVAKALRQEVLPAVPTGHECLQSPHLVQLFSLQDAFGCFEQAGQLVTKSPCHVLRELHLAQSGAPKHQPRALTCAFAKQMLSVQAEDSGAPGLKRHAPYFQSLPTGADVVAWKLLQVMPPSGCHYYLGRSNLPHLRPPMLRLYFAVLHAVCER